MPPPPPLLSTFHAAAAAALAARNRHFAPSAFEERLKAAKEDQERSAIVSGNEATPPTAKSKILCQGLHISLNRATFDAWAAFHVAALSFFPLVISESQSDNFPPELRAQISVSSSSPASSNSPSSHNSPSSPLAAHNRKSPPPPPPPPPSGSSSSPLLLDKNGAAAAVNTKQKVEAPILPDPCSIERDPKNRPVHGFSPSVKLYSLL